MPSYNRFYVIDPWTNKPVGRAYRIYRTAQAAAKRLANKEKMVVTVDTYKVVPGTNHEFKASSHGIAPSGYGEGRSLVGSTGNPGGAKGWIKAQAVRLLRNPRGKVVGLQLQVPRTVRERELWIETSGDGRHWVMDRVGSIHQRPFKTPEAAEKFLARARVAQSHNPRFSMEKTWDRQQGEAGKRYQVTIHHGQVPTRAFSTKQEALKFISRLNRVSKHYKGVAFDIYDRKDGTFLKSGIIGRAYF